MIKTIECLGVRQLLITGVFTDEQYQVCVSVVSSEYDHSVSEADYIGPIAPLTIDRD